VLAAMPANAAHFNSIVDKYGKTWISISGPIELYNYRRFKHFIDILPPPVAIVGLTLNSTGGSLIEAQIFASIIRGLPGPGIQTYVAEHRECSSACFLIWAAARYRQASPKAYIGVHSISVYGQETLDTNADTIDQARKLAMENVSPAVIGKLTSTTPDGVAWLTTKDLESMHVQIVGSNGAPLPLFAQ